MGARLNTQIKAFGATALALAAVAAPADAATRGAATCSYDDISGVLSVAAGNPKTIAVGVVRSGEEIVVRDELSTQRRPIGCAGPAPTVNNVETIVVDTTVAVREQSVTIDLSGGPLAPGRDAEGDGSSEIELDVTIHQRGRYPKAFLNVRGSAAADAITLGAIGNDTAANLNADEGIADADLVLHQRLDSRPSSQVKIEVDGSAGDDRIDASGGAPFGDGIDLGYGLLTLLGAEGDDAITGGLGDDRIKGGEGSDAIDGKAGADDLRGNKGDDTLVDLSGSSEINAGGGDDTIESGPGKDWIYAGGGNDTVTAGAGKDRIHGQGGSDVIDGGDDNDRIDGAKGDDTLDGGAGNDRIDGGGGDDRLLGGEGDDRLDGDKGDDELLGGQGDDRLNGDYRWGRGGDDRIVGGAGADRIAGHGGNDSINARDGEVDQVDCGKGDDTIKADADDMLKRCSAT